MACIAYPLRLPSLSVRDNEALAYLTVTVRDMQTVTPVAPSATGRPNKRHGLSPEARVPVVTVTDVISLREQPELRPLPG